MKATAPLVRSNVLPTWTSNGAATGGHGHRRSGWKHWKSCEFEFMAKRKLTPAFREFLACLNRAEVEYLLVGGFAVNHHGYHRHPRRVEITLDGLIVK